MITNLFQKTVFIAALFFVAMNINAQKGNTVLADFSFSSDQVNTAPAMLANAGSETSISLNIISPTNISARSKQGYSYAMKCSGIELSGNLSAIGSFELAVQNGSSGNVATYTVQVWDGTAWVTAETKDLAGNTDMLYIPSSIITKSAAKVKVTSSNSSWFYGLKIYNNTTADGAPALVSVSPTENSNLPSTGVITLQFDELVKAGTGTPTLGNATISTVKYAGNQVIIDYDGFTAATNPLTIPTGCITDYSGNALASKIEKNYIIDNTPPAFESASPKNNSTIHIGDLGEDTRKIKLTFSEDIKIGTGTIFFNGAIVTPSISGKVLTISYSGLPYNANNQLSIPASYILDLSNNVMASPVTLNYITGARDNTPPVLNVKSITDNAVNQPIGGGVYLTFDEIVIPGTAKATINGNPATLSNSGNVIGINYANLPYSSNISIDLPAGCVTDTCGNAYAGTSFSFTTAAKASKSFDFIVAKDGSGDYDKIQDAVNAANGTSRTLIYVKPGIYSEKIAILKDNISLIGEDADKVIITWNECASTSTLQTGTGINSTGTDASYTMLIKGNNFYGENFTVRNDYDYRNGTEANKQAVALEHITGDKHVLKNVKMYSFQDTYYPKTANTRQYLYNCYILGGTDFIFGSGTTFIDNSLIDCFTGGQYITAASDTQKEFGIILNNCNIKYADTAAIGTKRQFYLGRPWKAPAKTSYINCSFESGLIQNVGWSEWSGTDNHLYASYSEYNSKLQEGSSMDISGRVAWSKQLNQNDASRYNADNAFNYGTSGTWNPVPYITTPAAPSNVKVNFGSRVVTWTASEFAIGYLIFKNGNLLDKTIDLTCTDPTTTANANDSYTVKAYNEYGALSEASVAKPTNIKKISLDKSFLTSSVVSNELLLINPENLIKIEILDLNGKQLQSSVVSNEIISISSISNGMFFAKAYTKSREIMVEKIVKQ